MSKNPMPDRAVWEPLLERMEREWADLLARIVVPTYPLPRAAPRLPPAPGGELDAAASKAAERVAEVLALVKANIEKLEAWLGAARAVR